MRSAELTYIWLCHRIQPETNAVSQDESKFALLVAGLLPHAITGGTKDNRVGGATALRFQPASTCSASGCLTEQKRDEKMWTNRPEEEKWGEREGGGRVGGKVWAERCSS